MDNTKISPPAITPSTLTNLDQFTNEEHHDQANKCIYVYIEDGKFDAHKEIKKINGRWDGTGYLIDKKHENEIGRICSQFNLLHIEHVIPDNFDALPYYDPVIILEQTLEITKKNLISLTTKSSISYSEIDDLYTDTKQAQIKNHHQGKKILETLAEYQTITKKITWLINKKNATTHLQEKTFNDECQEELLGYIFNTPFSTLIEDGFDPVAARANIFSEPYRSVAKGINTAWEDGDNVSIAQVAINANNNSADFHAILKHISVLPLLNKSQAEQRVKLINEHRAENELNALKETITQGMKQNLSHHEIADIVRSKLNDIQSLSKTIFPQSHHLHRIVNEINNPSSPTVRTGITSLDMLLGGGLKKAELGVLAGGAGSGKTAFALQVADSIAARGDIVIYISIEIGEGKLTERSLKRLSYNPINKTVQKDCYKSAIDQYIKFANNIYLLKGHHGMQVSEIRGIVLSVLAQHKDKGVLLIIDPFQRLGTGNEKIDYNNETMKVGTLCSQIKEMAESLKIPILALSDTVKDHKSNKSGEGASRGTYMIDHTADYVMLLRTHREPITALYGDQNPEDKDDPFIGKIQEKISKHHTFRTDGKHALSGNWDRYAALITSKNRDGAKFSPLFIYKPDLHLFIDTELWSDIIK